MLDINKRVKKLRGYLNLNQNQFGDSIGLSTSGISNIENGARNVTEKHILLINKAFNVNENWLRTGKGEMFVEKDSTIVSKLSQEYNLNAIDVEIIKGYLELEPDQRKAITQYVKSIAKTITYEDEDLSAAKDECDIDKEVESYRLELEAEKKGTISSVSENGENIG